MGGDQELKWGPAGFEVPVRHQVDAAFGSRSLELRGKG